MSNKTKRLIHINDLHLGVQRSGGTTIKSAAALRDYAHEQHRKLLATAVEGGPAHIVVNGDLADEFDISLSESLRIYETTVRFLASNPDSKVTWLTGNHDLSKDSSKLGSTAFIGKLLMSSFKNFQLVTAPGWVDEHVYGIPHVVNQSVFELELSRVPSDTQVLLLHCNYENPHAAQSTHSLNLTREAAKQLIDRGTLILLGHEHQAREAFGGRLVVVGNQFPTSVADCLGNAEKFFLEVQLG